MSNKRVPWTRQELDALLPKIEKRIAEAEAEQEEQVKPLPPLTVAECLEYFNRFMDIAAERPLTSRECFTHGQLLSQFQQATQAEMLGKKGRYYVINEANIVELLEGPSKV